MSRFADDIRADLEARERYARSGNNDYRGVWMTWSRLADDVAPLLDERADALDEARRLRATLNRVLDVCNAVDYVAAPEEKP